MTLSLTQIWGNGDLDLFRSQIIFLSHWKLASSSVVSFTQIWGNCICPTPNFIFAHCVHTKFVESQCAHGNYCFTSEYILILKECVCFSSNIGWGCRRAVWWFIVIIIITITIAGFYFVVYFSEDNHSCSIAYNEIDSINNTIHFTYIQCWRLWPIIFFYLCRG